MRYRTKALIIGTAIGALFGAILALTSADGYDEAKSTENPIAALGPGDYFQLGISILTLARQMGQMLKRV
jgi:gas vesicle protein